MVLANLGRQDALAVRFVGVQSRNGIGVETKGRGRMSWILIDSDLTESARRESLYNGTLFLTTPTPATKALCDLAWEMIEDAFGDVDPHEAQDALPVEEFSNVIGPLKTNFTHEARSKEAITAMLIEFGCDPEETYFDIPRLRVVTHSNYLTAGLGYAYQPHRDIWYAAPPCQVNWWLPINSIGLASALAFHPQWWSNPVPNTSSGFDTYEWNATGRADAAKHVKTDTRNHPVPSEEIDLSDDIRIVGQPASTLMFSGAHLHSTVPNTSGRTRFSIDFRTINLSDLVNRVGAVEIDDGSTGTTARDFLRLTDRSQLPEDVVAIYDVGSTHSGPLVFDPSVVS